MKNGQIRTDLALEVQERFTEDRVEVSGVALDKEESADGTLCVTTVAIKNRHGAQVMQKPVGTYITIEAKRLQEKDADYHREVSEAIAESLRRLLHLKAAETENTETALPEEVLVVGLGNREVTPDALGPLVVDQLFVTRHLIREYGAEFQQKNELRSLSALAPGVMGQTGMEVFEILKGILRQTKPALVIVVDALAARSTSRLYTTVQLTDTGISPGAGIGNNRQALNKKTLGVDVVAIGVPTVVDAATIVRDRMEAALSAQNFSQREIESFLNEVTQTSVENLFVTPKNVDEAVHTISYTISEALNLCFSKTRAELSAAQ